MKEINEISNFHCKHNIGFFIISYEFVNNNLNFLHLKCSRQFYKAVKTLKNVFPDAANHENYYAYSRLASRICDL